MISNVKTMVIFFDIRGIAYSDFVPTYPTLLLLTEHSIFTVFLIQYKDDYLDLRDQIAASKNGITKRLEKCDSAYREKTKEDWSLYSKTNKYMYFINF